MASSLLNLASSPLNSLKSIPGSIGALTASQITPRLYLTDWIVAGNWAALSHLGITHVVSVVEVAPIIPGKIEHLHICISDLPICDISDHFERTTEFIHRALSKDDSAKVLVHCLGGLSRSASVVCAYLIAAKGLTAEEAIAYAHDCRRVTHPNAGFRKQLRDYAARYGLTNHEEESVAAAATQKNGVLSGITSGITGRQLPGMKLLRTGSVRQMVKEGVTSIMDGNNEVVKVARAKALGPDWQGAATIITHTSVGPDASINVDVTQTVVQPDSSVQVTETHATVQKDATISAETTSRNLPGLGALPAVSKLGFKIPGLPGLDQLYGQFAPTRQTSSSMQATALGLAHKPSVTQAVYDDLVHYFKFASTAYALTLPTLGRPNGQKLCGKMWDLFTDSHGYVARDDTRKEIIVAYRGSTTPMNFVTDALGMMVNWNPANAAVDAPGGTQVHFGFQQAWRSVSDSTIKKVTSELGSHPGYSIVCTGHSLGGAMASLCAVSLQKIFPSTTVKMYTYGQPRTGNETYARWVEKVLTPERIFRVVHSLDGVPTMAPRMLGFRHHGTEYWALSPPSSPGQTLICVGADGEEDPEGSMKIPTTGINPPNLMYFGIFYMMPFLF